MTTLQSEVTCPVSLYCLVLLYDNGWSAGWIDDVLTHYLLSVSFIVSHSSSSINSFLLLCLLPVFTANVLWSFFNFLPRSKNRLPASTSCSVQKCVCLPVCLCHCLWLRSLHPEIQNAVRRVSENGWMLPLDKCANTCFLMYASLPTSFVRILRSGKRKSVLFKERWWWWWGPLADRDSVVKIFSSQWRKKKKHTVLRRLTSLQKCKYTIWVLQSSHN